jgi:flagellar hook assembly protein FlgD
VAVEIFDLAGRRVRTLVDGPFTAGPHEFVWSGHDESDRRLPDGLYFARVRVPDLQFEEVRKLTLLK